VTDPSKSLREALIRAAKKAANKLEDEKDRRETAAAREAAELARHQTETAIIKQEIVDTKVDRKLRIDLSKRVFCYLISYSIFSGILIILEGFSILDFDLPDVVLTAVVGGTAVSAIGLVGFVVQGLYKHHK